MTLPTIDVFGSDAEKSLDLSIQACTDQQSVGGAANQAATVVLAAPANTKAQNNVGQVFWSYSGQPTAGRLTIADSSGVVFDQDLAPGTGAQFHGEWAFDPPRSFAPGSSVAATLASGGAGVTGKLNLNAWTQL